MSGPALLSIAAVAAELGVAAHVLRFWEERFAAVAPVRRAGGRRYYRPGDVALLRAVARLTRERGLTLAGIDTLLREIGPAALAARYGGGTASDADADDRKAPASDPDVRVAAKALREALAAFRQA